MNNGKTLLQIVPRAPSDCGGLGDYSEQLARGLQELHGITSIFVSAAPVNSSKTADGFRVICPLRALSDVLDSPAALLHYVNYGYNPRGVPFWLPSVLRRSESVRDRRLVTVFHELYAVGSWRQSAFWLRPLQMHIAKTLAGLSSISIVSNEIQQAQVAKLAPRARVVLQPVASNFGEPTLSFARLVGRDPHRWIICGGTQLVERSLTSFLQNVRFIDPAFSPRELFVVGGVKRDAIRARLGEQQEIRTHYHPNVEARAAAEILSTCAFAWIDYFHRPDVPMATILKSTTFAGFCSHGVIPVFPHRGSPIYLRQDTLPGPFFVTGSGQNLPSEQERAPIAKSIHDWYCRNASSFHLAKTVAAAIDWPA